MVLTAPLAENRVPQNDRVIDAPSLAAGRTLRAPAPMGEVKKEGRRVTLKP